MTDASGHETLLNPKNYERGVEKSLQRWAVLAEELREEEIRRIVRAEIIKSRGEIGATERMNTREDAMSTRLIPEEKNQEDVKENEEETRGLVERVFDEVADVVENFVDEGIRVSRLKHLKNKYGPKISDFVDKGTPILLNGKHLRGILFTPRKKEKA